MNEIIDRLRYHFDLTLAEAKIAFHLVKGETLKRRAPTLRISSIKPEPVGKLNLS
jgi:hypothetical protein